MGIPITEQIATKSRYQSPVWTLLHWRQRFGQKCCDWVFHYNRAWMRFQPCQWAYSTSNSGPLKIPYDCGIRTHTFRRAFWSTYRYATMATGATTWLCVSKMVIAMRLLLKKCSCLCRWCQQLKAFDNSAMKADHRLIHKHQQWQPLECGAGLFTQHLCLCLQRCLFISMLSHTPTPHSPQKCYLLWGRIVWEGFWDGNAISRRIKPYPKNIARPMNSETAVVSVMPDHTWSCLISSFVVSMFFVLLLSSWTFLPLVMSVS